MSLAIGFVVGAAVVRFGIAFNRTRPFFVKALGLTRFLK